MCCMKLPAFISARCRLASSSLALRMSLWSENLSHLETDTNNQSDNQNIKHGPHGGNSCQKNEDSIYLRPAHERKECTRCADRWERCLHYVQIPSHPWCWTWRQGFSLKNAKQAMVITQYYSILTCWNVSRNSATSNSNLASPTLSIFVEIWNIDKNKLVTGQFYQMPSPCVWCMLTTQVRLNQAVSHATTAWHLTRFLQESYLEFDLQRANFCSSSSRWRPTTCERL